MEKEYANEYRVLTLFLKFLLHRFFPTHFLNGFISTQVF